MQTSNSCKSLNIFRLFQFTFTLVLLINISFAQETWTATSTTNATSARFLHSSVWSFTTSVSAGDKPENNNGYSLYQNSEVVSTNCVNIKFSLKEDCYTIVYLLYENSVSRIMLVDDEVSLGTHGVMFKLPENTPKSAYTCIMQAYNSKGIILFDSSLKLK